MKRIFRFLTIWMLLFGCFTLNVFAKDDSLVSARFNLKYYGDGGYILLPNGVELTSLEKEDEYYVYDFTVEDSRFENTEITLTVYEPLASAADSYGPSPSLSDFDELKKEHSYSLKPKGSDYQYIWAYGDISSKSAQYTIDIINSAKDGYYSLVMEFKTSGSLSEQDILLAQDIVEAIVDHCSYVD